MILANFSITRSMLLEKYRTGMSAYFRYKYHVCLCRGPAPSLVEVNLILSLITTGLGLDPMIINNCDPIYKIYFLCVALPLTVHLNHKMQYSGL